MNPERTSTCTEARRPSLRRAVSLMCRECIYDSSPGNGTWREQTEACAAPKCPLFAVRPLTGPTREKQRRAATQELSSQDRSDPTLTRSEPAVTAQGATLQTGPTSDHGDPGK